MSTPALYLGAALAEIAGCFAFWAWLPSAPARSGCCPASRRWRSSPCCSPQSEAAAAGRAYAAYGGVYIAAALGWLWAVEGLRPDRWDLIGAAVCLAGAAIILLRPPRHLSRFHRRPPAASLRGACRSGPKSPRRSPRSSPRREPAARLRAAPAARGQRRLHHRHPLARRQDGQGRRPGARRRGRRLPRGLPHRRQGRGRRRPRLQPRPRGRRRLRGLRRPHRRACSAAGRRCSPTSSRACSTSRSPTATTTRARRSSSPPSAASSASPPRSSTPSRPATSKAAASDPGRCSASPATPTSPPPAPAGAIWCAPTTPTR